MDHSLYQAPAILITYVLVAVDLVRARRSIRSLSPVVPKPAPQSPRLSTLVAARNEELKIETALV